MANLTKQYLLDKLNRLVGLTTLQKEYLKHLYNSIPTLKDANTVEGDNTFSGNNTFSGDNNFTGATTFGTLSSSVLNIGQHEFYVDGSRTDTYTADGSILAPYKTILAVQTVINALAQVQIALGTQVAFDTTRYIVHIAPGIYTDNLTINNMNYLRYELNGATISGNILIATTQVGGAVTDDRSKYEFVGARGIRVEKGHAGLISGKMVFTRNNDSLAYVALKGIEVQGNISLGESTATSYGSWIVYAENCAFYNTSKYISVYPAAAANYIYFESLNCEIRCKIAKQDNSATAVILANCDNTSFSNDINTTPEEHCLIRNCLFTASKSYSIVAVKNLYIDANSYRSLSAATVTLTGMTIVPIDGVLPTATTLGFYLGSSEKWRMSGGDLLPQANNYDIGNTTIPLYRMYLSHGSIMYGAAFGTAGAGVTAVHYGDGKDITTVLTLTNVAVGNVGVANKGIGALIFTFPAGAHVSMFSYFSVGLTNSGGADASTPLVALGSLIASGVVAVLHATDPTMDDYTGESAAADVNGTAKVIGPVGVTAGMLTGIALNKSTDTKALNFNAAAAWGVAGNIIANGTVVIKWTKI